MTFRRRRLSWVLAFAAVAVAIAWAMPGCSSKSSGLGLASGCSLNSDCADPLVCIFSLCHQECASSRDCPNDEACVETSSGYGICQLPGEAPCTPTTPCNGGLVCGADDKCRAPCTTVTNCLMGQLCTSNVCYDPGELDGGSSSSGGGSGSSSGGGSGSSSGSSSGSGDAGDGGSGSACATAETQFGTVVQGDSNPAFKAGIGLRTATQLFIFDGYQGPDPTSDAGDAGTVNYIYAQAFDPVSGNSLGPASPLLAGPPDTNILYPEAGAVAPTGEIVLLYDSANAGLWASFFGAPAADAGVSGLHVQKSFQISTTLDGQPSVFWSPSAGAFVVTNIYGGSLMKVQKYLPNGNSAGNSTDPVPTDNVSATVSGYYDEGFAAGSNGLFGVGFVNSGANKMWLTVLNAQGNEVGSSFNLVSDFTSQWVTLGGTSAGFVGFYDTYQTGGIGEVLVPVAADGGISGPSASDAGDAGAYPGFLFPGIKSAVYARAINDDVGGVGGVGAAFLFDDGVDFAYVNPDGLTHVGMSTLISHTYVSGDYIHVNNTGGSFGVSLYSVTAHSTQLMTSTCTP